MPALCLPVPRTNTQLDSRPLAAYTAAWMPGTVLLGWATVHVFQTGQHAEAKAIRNGLSGWGCMHASQLGVPGAFFRKA